MEEEKDTTFESEEAGLEVKHAQNWLNDHGRPSFDYMMNIARRHTPQAVEIIMEWAERYNITFNPDRSLEETVAEIWTRMESSPDETYA